ncbi:kyphoscoliosis peptidase [Plakobranchus ocellatus]|uniref:Kyphoscoliosis peptidase n=1 Tax=Plakobranchus ocellatus TaxID=259542 RepID=A0AAV4BPV4_9GAST|nr:kyphoscoliosis peptidase [Plakobranchus ocellatus]
MNKDLRANQQTILTDLEHKATRKREASCKTIASRPDSGIAGSSSASYASSEAALLEGRHGSQADLIASSLEMLEHVYQIRSESHPTVPSLVKALTVNCHSAQAKAHALYRWVSGQSLVYYKCVTCTNPSSPTSKMKQLAEGKTTYAALYQEMARCAGLRCELVEGHVKGVNYSPGSPALCSATRHAWNAVSLNGHYALLDAHLGSLPYKFFLEHFFMTPPDEFCLSHYPKDKRWLLMTRAISEEDFFGALKTWPTMFAFNIRPLSMRSVIKTYDGRLSVTVLLHSVAVTPVLEYAGPGPAQDSDSLTLGIDQEIRNTDNAETFHMYLPQEGDYFFTLMVHDVEEDEDIPVFQYKIEYKDELL